MQLTVQQYALSVNGPLTWTSGGADTLRGHLRLRRSRLAIIGADFLRFFGLLVELGRKRLMDANTFYTVPVSYKRSSVS